MVKVLFIDDEPRTHRTLEVVLPDPYVLYSAYSARQGIEAVEREGPDVVLLDINLPDMDGIAVLRRIMARPCPPPVIMLTAMAAPRLVKEALLAGACDYIVKPYGLKELVGALRTAVAGADARRAAQVSRDDGSIFPGLIGESACMREVRRLVLRYASSDSPVLVAGESGTGKELVARAVHEASRRRAFPFVALNCGALPESLLESELFGVERGAYTDAVSRPGCFERANGGTLFLDEVGEMSAAAQTRLLRVIEQRELTRVGGTLPVAIDVRVVSATNRELRPNGSATNPLGTSATNPLGTSATNPLGTSATNPLGTSAGFRPDLYYRLGVLPIRVPPLRDRPEDIPVLAAHFLSLLGKPDAALSGGALGALCSHGWPGNVRELRSVMERAALCADDGSIRARDLLFD
jgi:DNA-binding NtrC family response regulator